MNHCVVDTHALFWYLIGSHRLGAKALLVFNEAAAGRAILHIPTIVLAELFFLNEKFGRPLDFLVELDRLHKAEQLRFESLTLSDVRLLPHLAAIPEMHDRLIAAVALRLNAACLTQDRAMTESQLITTIW